MAGLGTTKPHASPLLARCQHHANTEVWHERPGNLRRPVRRDIRRGLTGAKASREVSHDHHHGGDNPAMSVPSLRASLCPLDPRCSLAVRSMRKGAPVDVSEFARRGQASAAASRRTSTDDVVLHLAERYLKANPLLSQRELCGAIKNASTFAYSTIRRSLIRVSVSRRPLTATSTIES